METTKPILQAEHNVTRATLYMALELSASKWKVAISEGGGKVSHYELEAGDGAELLGVIEKARRRHGLSGAVRVVSCYEAGRDGFGLHRFLVEASALPKVGRAADAWASSPWRAGCSSSCGAIWSRGWWRVPGSRPPKRWRLQRCGSEKQCKFDRRCRQGQRARCPLG